jgi:hypothetical protein
MLCSVDIVFVFRDNNAELCTRYIKYTKEITQILASDTPNKKRRLLA